VGIAGRREKADIILARRHGEKLFETQNNELTTRREAVGVERQVKDYCS